MNKSSEPITLEETEKILEQMKKYICKINANEIYGTGFFLTFKFLDNAIINVLMTSYRLIDDEYLKENREINLLLNGNDTKVIDLEKKRKIYSNKDYDITLIELLKNDNINDYFELDENIFSQENQKLLFENKSIYIIHYLNMENVSVSFGFLSELNESEIKHTCMIKSGSYGSPILNFANNRIIGISKEQNRNTTFATFLKSPIDEFKKQIEIQKQKENINLKGKNINNITLKNKTFNSSLITDTNIIIEKPKMMIVFKTVKVSIPLAVDYGTTIRELLKKFLKVTKGSNKIDIQKTKIGFLFNSVRLNKNEKILKNVVEKYFNNRRLPTIIVTHL